LIAWVAWSAFVSAGIGAASAAALKIPAEHPRIFFTKADVAKFREQSRGVYAPQPGNSARNVIRENGFAYLIGGDRAAANTAIAAAIALSTPEVSKSPQGSHDNFEDLLDIAICYDWCRPVLGTAAETLRRPLIDAMEKYDYLQKMFRGAGHNMSTENSLAPLAAGLALHGEHPNAEKWMLEARRVVVDECMSGYQDKLCPDGDDFEGTQYHGARYQGEAIWCWLWFKGTGENLFTAQHPQLINAVSWWIYMLEPFLDEDRPFHLSQGDTTHRGISARKITSAAALALAAGDPYAGWYASLGRLKGWEAIALQPRRRTAPAHGLPLYRFFRRNMAIIRSGWDISADSRDTQFTFTCRDYMQGWHCHQDVNHFTISRRGELAIDSGVYAGNSDHARNYERATIAHNSMLVYDPAEPLPPDVTARDGGQVFRNDRQFVERTGAKLVAWQTYDRSDFRAFGVGRGYYYMCGDGTNAYNYRDFRKVENFTREIVYVGQVDPPIVVIFDRVTAAKPSAKKTWIMHTIQEPTLAGSTATVRHRAGQLIVQSLLPRQAVISTVGGPGKEYWVADPGQNYSASRKGGEAGDQGWHGNWRIEISPAAPAATDHFLTVLYPCDPGAAAPVTASIESGTRAGCEVAVGGGRFRILFNTSGATGGTFDGQPFAVSDPQAGR
jgi:hypothetical protein